MSAPIRGEFGVAEQSDRVHLFTADGEVSVVMVGLNSVPRAGETIEFGPGRLYEVQHVRWHIIPSGGLLASGTVTARVLLRPTDDTVVAG